MSFRFPDGFSLSSKLFRFSFWGFMFFILTPVRIVYQQGGSVVQMISLARQSGFLSCHIHRTRSLYRPRGGKGDMCCAILGDILQTP